MNGYTESGDQYLVKAVPGGVLIAAIDGLGHGEKAAVAAKAAVTLLEQSPHEPLTALFNRCHKRLMGTRGVVMSLGFINFTENTLTWLGVGNVHGVLMRADRAVHPPREILLLRGGTVGYRLPELRPEVHTITAGDTLIFVSDGVRSGFVHEVDLTLEPQQIADSIFEKHARGTDDTLVLVIQYTPEQR
ncbi:MAG: SpoIIE family protein phosphatase [Anaerolineae bacterium]|nr:SpoIIE family protein phosphatase [Anaerolineae bacterium]